MKQTWFISQTLLAAVLALTFAPSDSYAGWTQKSEAAESIFRAFKGQLNSYEGRTMSLPVFALGDPRDRNIFPLSCEYIKDVRACQTWRPEQLNAAVKAGLWVLLPFLDQRKDWNGFWRSVFWVHKKGELIMQIPTGSITQCFVVKMPKGSPERPAYNVLGKVKSITSVKNKFGEKVCDALVVEPGVIGALATGDASQTRYWVAPKLSTKTFGSLKPHGMEVLIWKD